MSVLVGIDADDDVMIVCQHGHRSLTEENRWCRSERRSGRTVTSHTSNKVDELLIRPTHGDRAGAGGGADESHSGHPAGRSVFGSRPTTDASLEHRRSDPVDAQTHIQCSQHVIPPAIQGLLTTSRRTI